MTALLTASVPFVVSVPVVVIVSELSPYLPVMTVFTVSNAILIEIPAVVVVALMFAMS